MQNVQFAKSAIAKSVNATQVKQGTRSIHKAYRLAKETPFQIISFGPLFTLDQAQAYQADMANAGKPVLVVNVNTLAEPAPKTKFLFVH